MGMEVIPDEVQSWIGKKRHEEVAEFDVERGFVLSGCSSVENGSPLYWDEETAQSITGGWIAPPTMISVWTRPHFCERISTSRRRSGCRRRSCPRTS
jgi:hypothetical protein